MRRSPWNVQLQATSLLWGVSLAPAQKERREANLSSAKPTGTFQAPKPRKHGSWWKLSGQTVKCWALLFIEPEVSVEGHILRDLSYILKPPSRGGAGNEKRGAASLRSRLF